MIDRLDRIPSGPVLLLARLGVAAVFFRSGLTKIANWDLTLQLFAEEYQVPLLSPAVAASLATAAEIACPVLLALGLAARLAALPLLGITLVIQLFVYPASWPDHLCWAALLILILARGPGTIALDTLVRARFNPRSASYPAIR